MARRSHGLGRPPQRKIVRERPDDFADASITAATHGDEPSADSYEPPPREDRAG